MKDVESIPHATDKAQSISFPYRKHTEAPATMNWTRLPAALRFILVHRESLLSSTTTIGVSARRRPFAFFSLLVVAALFVALKKIHKAHERPPPRTWRAATMLSGGGARP